MQAIILAAGKSTRTYPLTVNKPKPLLKIIDKTILEHNLNALQGIISEAIIIIGFEGNMIKKHLGEKYKSIKIKYVEQKQQLGTGHAVKTAQKHIKDKFIVMSGDDLFSKQDIKTCIKYKNSILVKEVNDPKRFGIIELTKDKKYLKKIVEKPAKPKSNLANTALYVLDKNILSQKIKKSKRNELEFTDFVTNYAKNKKITVVTAKSYWLPIGYPWNYLEANVFLLKNFKKRIIKGQVEKGAVIKGNVIIETGTIIKSGTYIEGPAYIGKNCKIGPLCHIRPNTIIMNNCEIGKMELYDVVVMNNTTSKHTSYAAHSVIGENVNIGAGLITADYRHDSKEHKTIINKKKIQTNRRKLGAFIGDNVKTGIGTLIYPGRKLWPDTSTLPGEIVKKDKLK